MTQSNEPLTRLAQSHLPEPLSAQPNEISWHEIQDLADIDPVRVLTDWESLQHKAQKELVSGHRGAQAVAGNGVSEPFERARYLALRHELSNAWQPRNAMEQTLIDQMAQTYTLYLRYLQMLSPCSLFEIYEPMKDNKNWLPARLSEAQSLELASQMVDRFNRLYLRTQRALRELRRETPPIVVQNAGQVNVAGQQINIAPGPEAK